MVALQQQTSTQDDGVEHHSIDGGTRHKTSRSLQEAIKVSGYKLEPVDRAFYLYGSIDRLQCNYVICDLKDAQVFWSHGTTSPL